VNTYPYAEVDIVDAGGELLAVELGIRIFAARTVRRG